MLTIDNWVVPLARHFADPLLSADRLRGLRRKDMIFMTREETDILALAALIPINRVDVVLAGLWVAEGSDSETGKDIVEQAIHLSHERGLTVIVPETLLAYVNREMRTPEEVGRPLDALRREMNRVGIPRKHAICFGGLQVIPAPVCAKTPGPIRFERNHCEL